MITGTAILGISHYYKYSPESGSDDLALVPETRIKKSGCFSMHLQSWPCYGEMGSRGRSTVWKLLGQLGWKTKRSRRRNKEDGRREV